MSDNINKVINPLKNKVMTPVGGIYTGVSPAFQRGVLLGGGTVLEIYGS